MIWEKRLIARKRTMNVTLTLAAGLLGGLLSRYLAPSPAFAQTQTQTKAQAPVPREGAELHPGKQRRQAPRDALDSILSAFP
jgi:hypothetical protein